MGTPVPRTLTRTFDYANAETLITHRVYWATTFIHDLKARLLLLLRQQPAHFDFLSQTAHDQTLKDVADMLPPQSGQAMGNTGNDAVTCPTLDELLRTISACRFDLPSTSEGYFTLYQAIAGGGARSTDAPARPERALAFLNGGPYETLPKPSRSGLRSTQLKTLLEAWHYAIDQGKQDPLLILGSFIVDLYNLSLFEEHNEVVCLLIGLHLLNRASHRIADFISIPSLLNYSHAYLVSAMRASSKAWETGRNDYRAFTEYLLDIILEAYLRFYQVYLITDGKPPTNTDRVHMIVTQRSHGTAKQDIVRTCPLMSETTVERSLTSLVKDGRLLKVGGGRSTHYVPSESHYGNIPALLERLETPLFT